jgi:biotin-dependent carboxylase-like uncharacterized protein
MNTIEILEPGLLTTVQDLGREGFGPLGVSSSGAADAVSLCLGNLLVGNPEGAPALEMTLVGGAFRFTNDAVIALAGSGFGASLDGSPAPLWESLPVPPGGVLRLGATRSGARCYLCVRGAIGVSSVLGSASTHILSHLGGLSGRPLRRDDVLPVGSASSSPQKRIANAKTLELLAPRKMLRVTSGPQSDWFPESSRQVFYASSYRVAEESNRMGLRLQGNPVPLQPNRELITEGVSLGAIQVPPSGQPIILFVEQQTTGGYPKIANVISADFHSLGQLRPRDEIRFELIDFETARDLLREQQRLISDGAILS